MRSIETVATVSPDGTLIARVPADVPAGEHQVVVVIEDATSAGTSTMATATPTVRTFPVRDYGPWPAGLSLRREDLYGDDAR